MSAQLRCVDYARYCEHMMENRPRAIHPAEYCPLCGELLGNERLNRDHVFGARWGGRAKVTTHWTCNNNIGKDAEGAMHRPWSVLSMFKLAAGPPAPAFPGHRQDGTQVQVDFATRTWAPSVPIVNVIESADSVSLFAQGSDVHLRKILKDWRRKWPTVPAFDELSADQKTYFDLPPEMVNVKLSHDLANALSVVKKVSLGAGVLAFGESFATGPVAAAIRAATLQNLSAPHEVLEGAWRTGTQVLEQMATAGVRVESVPLVLPAPKHQVVLMPIPTINATAVFVHILGFSLLGCGLIVDAELRADGTGTRTLPVMIREDIGPYDVVDLQAVLMTASTQAAADALADG